MFTPFFINSNIITSPFSLKSYESIMSSVAGNTGNSYITYALLKELGQTELADKYHIQNIYKFDFSKTDEISNFINANCTHVFFILQDQIRISESYGLQLPYNNIQNLLCKIDKPVIVAGLGANSFTGFDVNFYKQLNPNLVNFLHFLSYRCLELGVRGNFTRDVMEQLEIKNVVPIGCPSYFENGDNRILVKKNCIKKEKILFTSFYFNHANDTYAYQICQDEQEKNIIEAIVSSSSHLNIDSLDCFQKTKYINKRYGFFPNINDWKNLIKQFDFSIGYRLHGCILSLNSGLVSVCCNGDSRAAEMCNLLKIPYMPNLDVNVDLVKLYDGIDISDLNNSYNQLYENFNSFIERNCGIKIFTPHKETVGINQPSLVLYGNHSENSYQLILSLQDFKIKEIESNLRNEIERQNEKLKELSSKIEDHDMKLREQPTYFERQMENKIEPYEPILRNYIRLKKTIIFKIMKKIFYFVKRIRKD